MRGEMEDPEIRKIRPRLDRRVGEGGAGDDLRLAGSPVGNRRSRRDQLPGRDRPVPGGERPAASPVTSHAGPNAGAGAGAGKIIAPRRRILAEAEIFGAGGARRFLANIPEGAHRDSGADVAVAAKPSDSAEIEAVVIGP